MEPSFSFEAWQCVNVRSFTLSGHAQAKHLAGEAPAAAAAALPGLGTAHGHCGGARCSPLRPVHAKEGEPAWTSCSPCCYKL